MDARNRRQADAVAFLEALSEAPFRFDFYQTLRRLECLYDEHPRWGEAKRPEQERVRFGQDPDLSFAPAALDACEVVEGRLPRLSVRLFGLLGPNGPLPLHLTEYTRERWLNAGDPTLVRFLDAFQHRFIEFFYRAWAQAQPHVNRDRPNDDRFARYVGAFFGTTPGAFHHRDRVPDAAKLFHVGSLIRQVRNADGLAAILGDYFQVAVRIESFVGHWMQLGPGERTHLGREGAALGAGAVAGARVWDRQHKFRVHLGPLTLEQYRRFLPEPKVERLGGFGHVDGSSDDVGSSSEDGEGAIVSARSVRYGDRCALSQLVDWIRMYLSFELEWDVCLWLATPEVPPLRLGARAQLGWTSWLGRRTAAADVHHLCLDAEAFVSTREGLVG